MTKIQLNTELYLAVVILVLHTSGTQTFVYKKPILNLNPYINIKPCCWLSWPCGEFLVSYLIIFLHFVGSQLFRGSHAPRWTAQKCLYWHKWCHLTFPCPVSTLMSQVIGKVSTASMTCQKKSNSQFLFLQRAWIYMSGHSTSKGQSSVLMCMH